jgi:hypothetical protein
MMETRLHAQPKATLSPTFTPSGGGVLQRKCACGGSLCIASESDGSTRQNLSLQRSARNPDLVTSNWEAVPPTERDVLSSSVQPPDTRTRARSESRLGHHFGRIVVNDANLAVNRTHEHLFAKGDTDDGMRMLIPRLLEIDEPEPEEAIPKIDQGIVATSVAEDAAASKKFRARDWGLTWPETVEETVSAAKVGAKWRADLTDLKGHYSMQTRLLPSVQEVTGPTGNTTHQNFCVQLRDLNALGYGRKPAWFMVAAVVAHENVHAAGMLPGLERAAPLIQADFNRATIPDATGMTAATALSDLKTTRRFAKAKRQMHSRWIDEVTDLIQYDHEGPTDDAEHAVLDPMMTTICDHSREMKWAACDTCRP